MVVVWEDYAITHSDVDDHDCVTLLDVVIDGLENVDVRDLHSISVVKISQYVRFIQTITTIVIDSIVVIVFQVLLVLILMPLFLQMLALLIHRRFLVILQVWDTREYQK